VKLERISSVDIHAHLDQLEDVSNSLEEAQATGVRSNQADAPGEDSPGDGCAGHLSREGVKT
jgi:hypothetical protein